MTADHTLVHDDRPLPTRLGLCDLIPRTFVARVLCDRRRIVIDGPRLPWTDAEREEFLQRAHEAAQAGRFAA